MTKQILTAPRDWTPSRYKTRKKMGIFFPKGFPQKYMYINLYISYHM